MRVLHVAPYITPIYGGPSVAVLLMARASVCQGAEVTVVTTNAAGLSDLPLEDGAEVLEKGVKVRYFRRSFPKSWFYAPSMAYWLDSQIEKFNLIHLHVPFTAPLRWAAQSARSAGRRYVVTPHGVLDPWSLRQKAWKKRPYFRWLERKYLSAAALLHATSSMEAQFIHALQLGPQVDCLPLAVSIPPSVANAQRATEPVRILCIARLHPVKAFPVLFRTLALLRERGYNVVLDLAGEGDVLYVASLRKQVQSLGLKKAVIWHGYVDSAQKQKLYATASCFVLLSHHENFGLAAAEALAAGVPVVISDQIGLAPDVIEFQAGRVVPVGDFASTAEALCWVLDSANQATASYGARQLAEQRYSAVKFSSGLAAMYQHALTRPIMT